MAKRDMTIIDVYVDAADGAVLERLNKNFQLGLPRKKWWILSERVDTYRERVRTGLIEYFNRIEERLRTCSL